MLASDSTVRPIKIERVIGDAMARLIMPHRLSKCAYAFHNSHRLRP